MREFNKKIDVTESKRMKWRSSCKLESKQGKTTQTRRAENLVFGIEIHRVELLVDALQQQIRQLDRFSERRDLDDVAAARVVDRRDRVASQQNLEL